MEAKDIRWRQRFQNLKKAYTQFEAAIKDFDRLSVLEKEGLIQRFEYTFELSWKTLRDYLESQGISVQYPREVIKTAFQYDIIRDGDLWMDMLENRNLMSHTYDEERFKVAVAKIKDGFYDAVTQVYKELGDRA